MANIKNFKKEDTGNIKNPFENKIKSHKKDIAIKVLCAIVAVGLLIFLFTFYTNSKVYETYEVVAKNKMDGTVVSNYVPYGKDVLSYSKDGITCFNDKNESVWNQTFEMQEPMISVCNDYIVMGDYKGSKLFVLDKSGLQGEIDTMKPIMQLGVSEQGVIAAVLDEDETTWIYLYSKEGDEIAKIKTTINDSGYPIGISLSEDGIKLGVSYLRMSSGALSTSIAFYNFGSVGQNEIDNFVSGYDYPDMVAPVIKFINNKTAVAVGDNQLLLYNGNQKPKLVKKIKLQNEVQNVYYNDKYIALVFKDEGTNSKYRLKVYDEAGNQVLSKAINMEFKEIVINKGQIMLYNETELEILRLDGKKRFYGKLEMSAQKIIPQDSNNRFLVITSDSTQMIKLK